MSLMRLSVKKAAYADMSRAAYRKSGGIGYTNFEEKLAYSVAPAVPR
jgi:hypothetical protein